MSVIKCHEVTLYAFYVFCVSVLARYGSFYEFSYSVANECTYSFLIVVDIDVVFTQRMVNRLSQVSNGIK